MIRVLDDFFSVLAFLQVSTCFYLNLALLRQNIQINIKTMGACGKARHTAISSMYSCKKMKEI